MTHVPSRVGSWCPQEQLSPVLGTLTVRARDDMINHGFNVENHPVHEQSWGDGQSSCPISYRLLPKEWSLLISGILEGHSESWKKEMGKNKDNAHK